MALKWNTLQVIEAVDMAEKHINAIVEPLNCAEEVTKAALEIPHLPQYIESRFLSLLSEIHSIIGGGSYGPKGKLKNRLDAIRGDVPKEALELDRKVAAQGSRPTIL